MRTNNAKVRNTIISVYFVLIVMAIVLATVFSAFSDLTSSPFFTFAIVVLFFVIVFFVVHSISKYFEYDSDGMKVVLINKGLIITDGPSSRREQVLEFSKEDLVSFKFNNYIIYKSLTIYYNDSRGNKQKETFNVTLVNRKKRKYIRQSLSKMIKHNRKLKQ